MSEAYDVYPVTMAHPHFTPAKSVPIPGTERYDSHGRVVSQDYQGTPQRFPPVTAANQAEEERYKADGYERAGNVDPSAWVRAHANAPPDDYKPQKYPMWKDGKLIKTAQEDPDATEEDLAPPVAAAEMAQQAPVALDQSANALAAERELRAAQDTKIAQMQAEIERLSKLKDKRTAPKSKARKTPRARSAEARA